MLCSTNHSWKISRNNVNGTSMLPERLSCCNGVLPVDPRQKQMKTGTSTFRKRIHKNHFWRLHIAWIYIQKACVMEEFAHCVFAREVACPSSTHFPPRVISVMILSLIARVHVWHTSIRHKLCRVVPACVLGAKSLHQGVNAHFWWFIEYDHSIFGNTDRWPHYASIHERWNAFRRTLLLESSKLYDYMYVCVHFIALIHACEVPLKKNIAQTTHVFMSMQDATHDRWQ